MFIYVDCVIAMYGPYSNAHPFPFSVCDLLRNPAERRECSGAQHEERQPQLSGAYRVSNQYRVNTKSGSVISTESVLSQCQ